MLCAVRRCFPNVGCWDISAESQSHYPLPQAVKPQQPGSNEQKEHPLLLLPLFYARSNAQRDTPLEQPGATQCTAACAACWCTAQRNNTICISIQYNKRVCSVCCTVPSADVLQHRWPLQQAHFCAAAFAATMFASSMGE